jgi:hypothetical protein
MPAACDPSDSRRHRRLGRYYCHQTPTTNHHRMSSLLVVSFVLAVIKVFWGASETQHLSKSLTTSRPKTDTSAAATQHPVCRLPKACPYCARTNTIDATSPSSLSPPTQATSVIWYNYGDQAGLDDRRQILFTLANLAASLCARVAISPPHQLLDADRHATTVSPALEWNDLLQIQPLLLEDDDHPHYHYRHCESHNPRLSSPILWELRQPAVELVSQVYANHKRLATRSPQDFWRDFRELQKHVWNSNSDDEEGLLFVWEIKASWHLVKQQPMMIGRLPGNATSTLNFDNNNYDDQKPVPSVFVDSRLEPTEGCLSIDPWVIPEQMKEIVGAIWNDILGHTPRKGTTTKRQSLVGFLHIRRGDSQERCDTSLEKIRSYLTCSLKTLPKNAGVVLLLASDETNSEYRQGIAQILDEIMVVHEASIKLLDLDSLVLEYIRRSESKSSTTTAGGKRNAVLESNYYVYAIESVLKREYVDFVLEQRQTQFCQDCQNLSRVVVVVEQGD